MFVDDVDNLASDNNAICETRFDINFIVTINISVKYVNYCIVPV